MGSLERPVSPVGGSARIPGSLGSPRGTGSASGKDILANGMSYLVLLNKSHAVPAELQARQRYVDNMNSAIRIRNQIMLRLTRYPEVMERLGVAPEATGPNNEDKDGEYEGNENEDSGEIIQEGHIWLTAIVQHQTKPGLCDYFKHL